MLLRYTGYYMFERYFKPDKVIKGPEVTLNSQKKPCSALSLFLSDVCILFLVHFFVSLSPSCVQQSLPELLFHSVWAFPPIR